MQVFGENEISVLEMNGVEKVDLDFCTSLCISYLSTRAGHTAAPLECHHVARAGQWGDQALLEEVWEKQVLFDLLLWQDDPLSWWEKGCGWMLRAWTPVKPSTLCPIAFTWRNGCSWLGWVCYALARNLSGWLCPESGGEWNYIQLAVSHQCSYQGLSIRVSSV